MSTKNFKRVETSLSSVEIKRTSNGINFRVKVYDENPELAEKKAIQIYKRLQKRYGE